MGGISICITVDWEGESLDSVGDLLKLREKFGTAIPLTHFICPNYFVRDKKPELAVAAIKQAIKPNDEVGLHIHCYRELIESTPDVSFRTKENYHNTPGWFEQQIIQRLFPTYQRKVSGRGVPLSVYSKEEIKKIIQHSRALLTQYLNITDMKGFRAGGWIVNDNVMELVEEAGFEYDSSAVAPSIFSQGFSLSSPGNKLDDFGDNNGIFTEHILKLWGHDMQEEGFLRNKKILKANKQNSIYPNSQPYPFNRLIEIPNNCALSDFCSPHKTVLPLIGDYLKELEKNPEQDLVIVYGCHQEGEMNYKQPLLELIRAVSKLDSSAIQFKRMSQVSAPLRTQPAIS